MTEAPYEVSMVMMTGKKRLMDWVVSSIITVRE
jgi:hypothetical protein